MLATSGGNCSRFRYQHKTTRTLNQAPNVNLLQRIGEWAEEQLQAVKKFKFRAVLTHFSSQSQSTIHNLQPCSPFRLFSLFQPLVHITMQTLTSVTEPLPAGNNYRCHGLKLIRFFRNQNQRSPQLMTSFKFAGAQFLLLKPRLSNVVRKPYIRCRNKGRSLSQLFPNSQLMVPLKPRIPYYEHYRHPRRHPKAYQRSYVNLAPMDVRRAQSSSLELVLNVTHFI